MISSKLTGQTPLLIVHLKVNNPLPEKVTSEFGRFGF